MSITHLIIQDEEKKRQQRKDDQRPALRIPALDPSTWPDTPRKKETPTRGVCIIDNGGSDDESDESPNRGVTVITNGYEFN